jgi:hypothetical protein
MKQCILVDTYQRFGETYYLHLHGFNAEAMKVEEVYFSETLVSTYESTCHHNPEDHHCHLTAVRTPNFTNQAESTPSYTCCLHVWHEFNASLLAESNHFRLEHASLRDDLPEATPRPIIPFKRVNDDKNVMGSFQPKLIALRGVWNSLQRMGEGNKFKTNSVTNYFVSLSTFRILRFEHQMMHGYINKEFETVPTFIKY